MPKKLKEFFVESDPEELDDKTKEEFNLILKRFPLYIHFIKK